MKHHLIKFHKAMAAMHKRHGDALDDGHEMKGFHTESAGHHEALHKALLEPASNDPTMPFVGNEGRRGSSELVPTKARCVMPTDPPPRGTLVLRTGMDRGQLEKAEVAPELEDALGNL